jgi:hypothetical protein
VGVVKKVVVQVVESRPWKWRERKKKRFYLMGRGKLLCSGCSAALEGVFTSPGHEGVVKNKGVLY